MSSVRLVSTIHALLDEKIIPRLFRADMRRLADCTIALLPVVAVTLVATRDDLDLKQVGLVGCAFAMA